MSADPASLRVVIDRKLCVGTSNCAEEAPEAFEMDEAGQPHALGGASAAAVLAGAQACPVGAIACFDVATGRRIFP